MSKLPILQHKPKHEELILVAFRLDPRHDGPEFYTLLAVGGDDERPPMAEARIVFFTRPELAAKALALDDSLVQLGAPPKDVETFCDVAEALYRVNSQNADPDGVILDCLLMFDDLVRATRLHMPDRYQGILTELAAGLTEGTSLQRIFSSPSLREHVEDALLWCVGAITVKARLLNE
ncbi:MAG: hypothetical protein P4M04_07765 [Acidobacteriota bacterium]|nr:hypothetical protein [Acidobacteriota bacterium]